MSLEGDCHEVQVTPNSEFLVTFGMPLEGVCHELYTLFHYKLIPNLEATKNSLGVRKLWVWSEVGPRLKICPQASMLLYMFQAAKGNSLGKKKVKTR
jgi:hypothetical protein